MTRTAIIELRVLDDDSGHRTMALFDSARANSELFIDSRAQLVKRPPSESEMSGLVAEAIAFLPNLLALPGFALAMVELIQFFRTTQRQPARIELSGPRGRVEISPNISPEQLRQVIEVLLEPTDSEEDSGVGDAN